MFSPSLLTFFPPLAPMKPLSVFLLPPEPLSLSLLGRLLTLPRSESVSNFSGGSLPRPPGAPVKLGEGPHWPIHKTRSACGFIYHSQLASPTQGRDTETTMHRRCSATLVTGRRNGQEGSGEGYCWGNDFAQGKTHVRAKKRRKKD